VRISDGVEWALHSAVVLGFLPPQTALPTARLAEYHGVPAAYLAKHLQALSRAGILDATQGPRGGYRLSRPAADITVLEVVEAIEGRDSAFQCTEIRRRGPASVPAHEYRVPCSIHVLMDRADAAWRSELAATTVADLVGTVIEQASPRALAKGAAWMQEVFA
jgi:Rrf2 family protein